MNEVSAKQAHFLDMTLSEKLTYRDCKIVNGYFLFVICLLPEVLTLCRLSLFTVTNGKPLFIGEVHQEMWKDDGYLIHIINKKFPC